MLSKISGFVMRRLARLRSEVGQALAEYGLILALVVVVSVFSVTAVGTGVVGELNQVVQGIGDGGGDDDGGGGKDEPRPQPEPRPGPGPGPGPRPIRGDL